MKRNRVIGVGFIALLLTLGFWIFHRGDSSERTVSPTPLSEADRSISKNEGISRTSARMNEIDRNAMNDLNQNHLGLSDNDESSRALQNDFTNSELLEKEQKIQTFIKKKISTIEHADQRIHLDMSETVEVFLDSKDFDPNQSILVRAEDGGVINGKSIQSEVLFEAGALPESFTFTIGIHRGLYVLSIMQGQSIQRLEFWAGSPLPKGEAGPRRNIIPPKVLQ